MAHGGVRSLLSQSATRSCISNAFINLPQHILCLFFSPEVRDAPPVLTLRTRLPLRLLADSELCFYVGAHAGDGFDGNMSLTVPIHLSYALPPSFIGQVLAYDIECTKAPLKFPNVEIDQVLSVSLEFAEKLALDVT